MFLRDLFRYRSSDKKENKEDFLSSCLAELMRRDQRACKAVLKAVGFPPEQMEAGVAIILAVDRALDMCRTTVNVWGDTIGAAVIGASEGELQPGPDIEL